MIEVIAVSAVVIGGYLFILRAGIRDWGLPALGYVAGTCLLIDFGFLQIISGLPTAPALTLTLTVVAPFCWWLSQREHRLSRYGLMQIVITLIAVACLVYFFRNVHLVGWSNDSLRYLEISTLIAGDNFQFVPPNLLTQRALGLPIIHAPANLAGEFYLRSAGPLLAISAVGIFVWLSLKGLASDRANAPATFTILGVLLLVTSNRMLWSAFALYPHLLTAVLILLITGAGWLIATTGDRLDSNVSQHALVALQSTAIPALVVARPEGGLLAAIAILPTLLCGRVAVGYRAFLLCVFGTALTAWNLLLISHSPADAEIPAFVLGPLVIGSLSLAVAALLFSGRTQHFLTVLEPRISLILIAAEVALWLALAAAIIWDPEILLKSVSATTENLLYGAGGWGYSLVILALLALICSAAARGSDLILLRFPVTSFIPLGFLLAYLRDSPYRVGVGDSLNRMWIHIVPLTILFIVAAMSSGRWPSFRSRFHAGTSGLG